MFNTIKIKDKEVEYKKISNCVYGNPRYAIHFLQIDDDYLTALNKSRSIGGKKSRAKDLPGFIIISSYNLASDLNQIIN